MDPNHKRQLLRTGLVFLVFAFAASCMRTDVQVRTLPQPSYPDQARIAYIQGIVQVGIEVGTDGKVLSAHGSGANPVLVRAAEDNARQWVWGPFPRDFEFPWYHEISYEYELKGKPASVVIEHSSIKTHLPDEIEIVATPYRSDFDVRPVKSHGNEKPR